MDALEEIARGWRLAIEDGARTGHRRIAQAQARAFLASALAVLRERAARTGEQPPTSIQVIDALLDRVKPMKRGHA